MKYIGVTSPTDPFTFDPNFRDPGHPKNAGLVIGNLLHEFIVDDTKAGWFLYGVEGWSCGVTVPGAFSRLNVRVDLWGVDFFLKEG